MRPSRAGSGSLGGIAISGFIAWNWDVATYDTGSFTTANAILALAGGSVFLATGVFSSTLGSTPSFSAFTFDPALSPSPCFGMLKISIGNRWFNWRADTVIILEQSATKLQLGGTGRWISDNSVGPSANWVFDKTSSLHRIYTT